MKPLWCSLLALVVGIALSVHPTSGVEIRHTTPSGQVIDSGYTIKEFGRSVGEIKKELAEQYQSSADAIHIWSKGVEMPDGYRFTQDRDSRYYHHFFRDSNIIFDFTLIKVSKPDGSYIVLGGEKKDTVASFKDKIAKKENVPREMQRLIGTTRELLDGEQLANSPILNETSYVVSVQWKPARVRVRFPCGEVITFEYEHTEKVANLKKKIQQAKGIARERQCLLLKGVGELYDDGKSLISFNLTKVSILTLVERDPSELDIIHVRLASKRLLTFEIDLANDTVASLKKKINRAEGFAQEKQHLFSFKGKEMGTNRLLSDYITKSESVVDLLLCSDSDSQGPVAEHHLHFWELGQENGLKFHLNLEANDTVASVKQALKLKKTMPQDYTPHLFFDNNELEDNKPMLEHVINNGSMLQRAWRAKDKPAMIHVRLPTGRLISFELETSNTVGQLKEFVDSELEAYKMSGKQFFFNSLELKDNKTLNDYNIVDGSTINLMLIKP